MLLMQRWWIKLLPLTTANFVNLSISPSIYQIAALHIAYACVAIFLCIVASSSMTMGLIVAFCLDGLLTEWLSHTKTLYQQRGCLQLNEHGEVQWRQGENQCSGFLIQISLQTRYLIVISATLHCDARQHKTQRYFVIDPCCCCENDFRTLSLYTRSIISFRS
ncbi:protein YgfX [Photobacterium swingsii]|uniref:protein YgfX n=2 Tax=Photobacterium swingsii TaxID=680026 RepID=UPI0026ABE59D